MVALSPACFSIFIRQVLWVKVVMLALFFFIQSIPEVIQEVVKRSVASMGAWGLNPLSILFYLGMLPSKANTLLPSLYRSVRFLQSATKFPPLNVHA